MDKSRLLSLGLILGVVALAIGTGVMSWFDDQENLEGNVILTGSIDLQLLSDPFVIEDMKPCKTFEVRKIIHVYDNPFDIYLRLDDDVVPGCLADQIDYSVKLNATGGYSYSGMTLADMINGGWKILGNNLEPCVDYEIIQVFHMKEGAGNKYQGLEYDFDEIFYAVQWNGPAP